MQRREVVRGVAALFGTVAVAGCGEVEEIISEATEEAGDEAEGTVNETLDDLARPPDADVEMQDDGSVLVFSLGADTVGVKCGLIEGDNPITEVQESEQATTTPGTTIEDCSEDRVIAVNEAGDVDVVAER